MIADDLLFTYRKYPLMRAQDFVKMLYQGEYGGAHGNNDDLAAADSLKKEIKSMKPVSFKEELVEDISANFARVNLRPFVASGKNVETLREMFVKSRAKSASRERLDRKLEIFTEQCCVRKIDLPYLTVKKFVNEYKAADYPVENHSMTYRLNYFPAYRVVRRDFFGLFDIIDSINSLLKAQANLIVAIDGMSGSGKTYTAEKLKEYFDCNIIHTDDFFLPSNMRTPERLSKIGGNIHFERLAPLLKSIKKGDAPVFDRYDCKTDSFEKAEMPPKRLTIVEGCYSLHQSLINSYDGAALFKVNGDVQLKRILDRSGAEMLKRYREEWIPMENRYFEAVNLAQLPVKVIDTSDRKILKTDF